ncbi:MAG: extracellular solute-binding protein [Pseudomonadota bacterium]
MKTTFVSAVALAAVLGSAANAQSDDRIKFEYWYALGGYLGDVIQSTCDSFNASQDTYEIVCVGQGGYSAAVQNSIAAFRADKHPTMTQTGEGFTADMMLSGEFYSVTQMMTDFGIEIDWDDYFPGIASYWASSTGELYALPFNVSTPVVYYNVDDFNAAGIEPAETWEEFEANLRALKATNPEKCAMAWELGGWVELEQFSMIHNIPVASNNNGFDGLDAELVYNTTLHVKHMEDRKRWFDDGLMEIKDRAVGAGQRSSFTSNQCSVYMNSIGEHQTVHESAVEGLNWDVSLVPVYEGYERHNTVVGGGALWVLSGKTEGEYRGAAEYLKFLSTPESAIYWSSNTGYIPVTNSGYQAMMADGFYENPPYKGRELAIESLTVTPPTSLTRGMRLGFWVQSRSEWVSEIQAAFAGEKTIQEALDAAVERGNRNLRKFERTYSGKQLP